MHNFAVCKVNWYIYTTYRFEISLSLYPRILSNLFSFKMMLNLLLTNEIFLVWHFHSAFQSTVINNLPENQHFSKIAD